MVKGGPATRRRYLDDVLVARSPKHDALRTDLDRILRQRNALLKQMAGRPAGRGRAGHARRVGRAVRQRRRALVSARVDLLARLAPALATRTRTSQGRTPRSARSTSSRGTGDLGAALRAARDDDIRRGVTTGRSAPRRARPDDRRAAGPHPRVAGRAAITCARAAPRRAHVVATETARRRCCCSTTCSPSSTRPGRPRCSRTSLPDRRCSRRQAACLPSARPRSWCVHVRGGSAVVSDHRVSRVPSVTASIVSRDSLSGVGAQPLASVFTEWPTGSSATPWPRTAGRSRSTARGLVIGVDEPAWATQIRYLERELIARLAEASVGLQSLRSRCASAPSENDSRRGRESGRRIGPRNGARNMPVSTGIVLTPLVH